MSHRLEERTWPEVEQYLQNQSRTLILPVGSTEQHGPSGILGIDFLTSQTLALAAGEKLQLLVGPTLPFGMAQHHLAFPGTLSLQPTTYIAVIVDLIKSVARHGFNRIWFINGHGGNIAPMTTAFCQYLESNQSLDLHLINWWHLPEVTSYEKEKFGDLNGFHATCGEISLTQFTHPQAYTRTPHTFSGPGPQKTQWPVSPEKCRELFPEGHMGSLPSLASAEHGKTIYDLALNACVQRIKELEKSL